MILITGASSGIGEACARAFSEVNPKAELFLVARRREKLESLSRELKEKYPKLTIHCATVDVSNRKGVSAFLEKYEDLLKMTKILVNNAGLAKGLCPIQEGQIDDWEVMIDTNIKGVLYFTHGILPHMLQAKEGHIINIGSVAGHYVYPKGNIYSATKHALKAINEALRIDLVGSGIRVTAISPGMVETEFSVVRLGDEKKAKAVYEGMTPLVAKDIAEAVVWSATRPKHVNIQDIIIYPTDQASPTVVARKPIV